MCGILSYVILLLSPFSPNTEDVQVSSTTETTESETQTTDEYEQELPPVEGKPVTPQDKDEEEPISSTIIFLDKDEVDEDKGTRFDHQHQENQRCWPQFSSSLCSCASSFQEFVQQQCSASLSIKRACKTTDRKKTIVSILTPTWHSPLPPSSCPQPQPDGTEDNPPHGKGQASEQEPESEAVLSEAAQSSGSTGGSVLEPSQSLNLPKLTLNESSFIKPTPAVETPKLSSEEPAKESEPEMSQEVSSGVELSASASSSAHVKPTICVSGDTSSAAPTEERPDGDIPIQTQERTSLIPVLSSTPSSSVEHQTQTVVVPEITPVSSEVSPSVSDSTTEPQSSISHMPETDTKMEEPVEDLSTSSAGSGQLFHPSPPKASSPTPPSLSDIYAEPFNGTEQNGNLIHSSNQKESVFMRLNNRIKALEVNMSLSGRYLEQLSQR